MENSEVGPIDVVFCVTHRFNGSWSQAFYTSKEVEMFFT